MSYYFNNEDDFIDDNGDHHLASYDSAGRAYYADRTHAVVKPSVIVNVNVNVKPIAPKRGSQAMQKYILLVAKSMNVDIKHLLQDPKRREDVYKQFFGASREEIEELVSERKKLDDHGSHFPDKTSGEYAAYRSALAEFRSKYGFF
jgi:hypothetical protein